MGHINMNIAVKTRFAKALAALILMLGITSEALANNKFFEQRYRGWLWFEEKERAEDKKIDISVPTPEEAKASIEARKQALENARNVMLEAAYRPNISKKEFLKSIEDYRRLEQEMQFMSLKVGMAWDETNMLNPEFLDEINNPSNMYGRKKKEELDNIENDKILRTLARSSEIFVIRSGSCGYCPGLEQYLNRFAKKYGFKVEAVSVDSSDSPYFKTTHSPELVSALGARQTPTVFLVSDQDNHRYQLAEGLVSIETLERRTLQAASLLRDKISLNNKNRSSDEY